MEVSRESARRGIVRISLPVFALLTQNYGSQARALCSSLNLGGSLPEEHDLGPSGAGADRSTISCPRPAAIFLDTVPLTLDWLRDHMGMAVVTCLKHVHAQGSGGAAALVPALPAPWPIRKVQLVAAQTAEPKAGCVA